MNDDIRNHLHPWPIAPLPPQKEEQLWRQITALPQKKPLAKRLWQATEKAFADWQYGLAYKLAGLACCALLGFFAGMQQQTIPVRTSAASALVVTDIALARVNWMEGL